MKKLMKISGYQIVAIIGSLFVMLIFPSFAYGLSPIELGALSAQGNNQPTNLFGATGIFTIISNTMLFVVGALSVIMLIVGGLRYIVSGGNNSSVTSAKNTVLYAIIGLIIALLAYAAINFVLTALVPGISGISNNI